MKILTEYKNIISKVGTLKKAYFTTFNINTQFVEKFILPPLLNSTIQSKFDYADLDRKIIEVKKNKSLDIKFFYDYNMLSEAEQKQTTIEFYPIRQTTGVFHPKVIYLEGDKASYLMVGSGNLTKAGWSENIECWNWIDITNNENLIKQKNSFMEAVFKLAGLREAKYIKAFKDNEYKILPNEDNFIFTNIITKAQSLLLQTLEVKSTTNLQIWSPYFSNKIDEIIKDSEYFKNISYINIVPDLIQNQRIRLEQKTINELSSNNKIRFFRDIKNEFQTNHSKVWITDKKIAIGSYNFTKEAIFGNNFEASLILNYSNIKELNPVTNKRYEQIDNLREENHQDDEVAENNKKVFKRVFKLIADWKTRTLTCTEISNSEVLTDVRIYFKFDTKYSINKQGILMKSKDELSESEKENIFDNILLNKSFHVVDMNNDLLFKGLLNEQNISLIDIETKKIASLSDMFSLSMNEIKYGRRFNDREEYDSLLEKQESCRYESNNYIDYFDIFTLFKTKNDIFDEIKKNDKDDKELRLFCIRGSSSLLKMKEILKKEKSNGRKDLSLYLMIDELNDLINKVPTEYGLKVLENVLELKKEDTKFIKEIKIAVIKETYCE